MNAGELRSVPAAGPRERRHSYARRSAATVLAALLGAWLHVSATSVGATPPSQDPYHVLAPLMGLEEAQATLEPGKPVAAWLEFTRPAGTSTLQLLLRATDATVEVEAGDVTASFLETSAEGDLYEIDATGLPEGGKNRLALTLVLEGETGAGVTARLWDVAAAAPADAWLAFAVDESGTVTPVERAGNVTAAHLKRFEAADDWARAEVLRSETATWEAPIDDPDPYRVTDPNLRKRIRWPKGSGSARSASKKIHRLWDANIGRGSGVRFAGRLVFRDDGGCSSPTRAHNIPWNQCHAFKRRLDASMQPVTVDAPVSPGYRPLPATVILLYEAWRDGAREKVCDITAFETSLDGRFMIELQPCNVAPGGNLEYRVQATVMLEALMIGDPTDPDSERGTMRAVWPIERMDRLFPPGPSPDVVRWLSLAADRANPGTLYTVPALRFTHASTAAEIPGSLTQLGARILAADGPASFNYLRQALSAWATMVTLHERLQGHVDLGAYMEMFRDPGFGGRAFRRSYLVFLDGTWAFGWAGGLRLLEPRTDVAPSLLSETSVLGHEFGHSVHGALGGTSMAWDNDFADRMMMPEGGMSPTGRIYTWGHGDGQYQEMGMSLVEGISSSIGQFLMNECRSALPALRTIGAPTPDFLSNMWSGTGVDALMPNGSPIHHARWFLVNRAMLAETSAAYGQRLTALRTLTTSTAATGHTVVRSNSEGRYGAFGCDLLDAETDVSYVAGLAPTVYATDFTHDVWKTMTGVDISGQPSQVVPWSGPDGPEEVRLTLAQLLDALANFCPDCATPAASADYGNRQLSSTSARQSPQALARYLVGTGAASADDLRDALKANFMETWGF